MVSSTFLYLSHNSAIQFPTYFKLDISCNLFNFHIHSLLFFFFNLLNLLLKNQCRKRISGKLITCSQTATPDPNRRCFDKDIFPFLHTFNGRVKITKHSKCVTCKLTISKTYSVLSSDESSHQAKHMQTKFAKPSFTASSRSEKERSSTQRYGNTAHNTGNTRSIQNKKKTHFESLHLVAVLCYKTNK